MDMRLCLKGGKDVPDKSVRVVEWELGGDGRRRRSEGRMIVIRGGYALNIQHSTFNTQHSTHNGGTNMATGGQSKYDLEERLLEYAARVIRLTDALPKSRAGAHVADQLLRSGTSPLSNHGEAQAAESPDDFIHKLSVALKELKESRRWLRLIVKAQLVKETQGVEPLLMETEELIRIFAASIRTARARKARK